MFKNLGTIEIVIVSFVILGLFGSKKLNELAKGLGKSKKEIENLQREAAGTQTDFEESSKKEEPSEE